MMSVMQQLVRVGVCLAVIHSPLVALAQDNIVGGPLTGPPVLKAPFSAEATTIVRQTLSDGTRIERRGNARYYRDSAGRVRVEQTILGLEALRPTSDPDVRITIAPDPNSPLVFTLDPATRTAMQGPRAIAAVAVGGGDTFAVPLGGPRFLIFNDDHHNAAHEHLGYAGRQDESLGTRSFGSVAATGRRTTVTIPAGQVGNDRPMQIVHERWESPELKIVLYARTSDPRTGVMEYQVTNINRNEPPADLFIVPPDYPLRAGGSRWITLESPSSPSQRKGPAAGRRW